MIIKYIGCDGESVNIEKIDEILVDCDPDDFVCTRSKDNPDYNANRDWFTVPAERIIWVKSNKSFRSKPESEG